MRAFAAGDALGVPWEGRTAAELRSVAVVPLGLREDWPRGSTSDDTAQLMLMARALLGDAPAAAFMESLAREAGSIRGMGPSSLAAVERYRRDGSLLADGGATNGALMRAPAIGWGARDVRELSRLVVETTRTTHADPRAIEAAERVALAAFNALRGELPEAFEWDAPADGVSMDATESADAVLYVVSRATDVADAAEMAVRLGGDTDTIAAIAAGVLASHPDHAADPIPWLGEVLLPEQIDELARALAERKA